MEGMLMTINKCLEDIKKNINCFDAVFIDGEWGIGKTYPFKKNDGDSIFDQIIYISVFGLSNSKDLYEKFYDKLFILSEDNIKKIEDATNGIDKHFKNIKNILMKIPVIAKIFNNNSNKNEDEMLSNVKLLGILNLATSAIRNYVIKNVDISNKIIVIDDLERKSNKLDINEIEGFVDYVIRERGAKVILIGNTKNLENGGEENKEIIKIKDKICDRFYTIDEVDNKSVISVLDIDETYDNNILNFIGINNIINMRSMYKAKRYFETTKQLLTKESYDDEFVKKLHNTLKLIFIKCVHENIDKKLTDSTKTKNEDRIIDSLVEYRKRDVKTYMLFNEYKYENCLNDLIVFVENYLEDSSCVNLVTFVSLVNSLYKLHKDTPFMFLDNDKIVESLNAEINIGESGQLNAFEVMTKYDSILEFINKYYPKKSEEFFQQYILNIKIISREYVDNILKNNTKQYNFSLMMSGLPDIIHNQRIKDVFNEMIYIQAYEMCVEYINDIANNKNIFENIELANRVIRTFDLNDKVKLRIKDISFNLQDKVYNECEVENIKKILWFISVFNYEYYLSIIDLVKNEKYSNISASLVRDSIINEYNYYFKEQ